MAQRLAVAASPAARAVPAVADPCRAGPAGSATADRRGGRAAAAAPRHAQGDAGWATNGGGRSGGGWPVGAGALPAGPQLSHRPRGCAPCARSPPVLGTVVGQGGGKACRGGSALTRSCVCLFVRRPVFSLLSWVCAPEWPPSRRWVCPASSLVWVPSAVRTLVPLDTGASPFWCELPASPPPRFESSAVHQHSKAAGVRGRPPHRPLRLERRWRGVLRRMAAGGGGHQRRLTLAAG